MATNLETLIKQIRALRPEEQQFVRQELDEHKAVPANPDEAYQHHLVKSGLLKEVKHRARDQGAFDRFKPVEISGPPLSETIIQERR